MVVFDNSEYINITDWRELSEQSSTESWFQTKEAYDFYTSLPAMMSPFLWAVENEGALRGLVAGYVTKDTNPLKQFFTRRAIIYGGPLLADDITDEELTALLHAVSASLKKQAIYIESRNFCDYSRWRDVFVQCGWKYKPHYDIHVDCTDRNAMIGRLSKSKKQQIRKAQTEGIEVMEATELEDIQAFYVLLQQLYRRKVHRPLFSLDFFTTFVRQNKGVLLLVKQQGRIIGGTLCAVLQPKGVMYEWYAVGPAIVTWATMEYAYAKGIAMLDLMGAGEPGVPYGVRDFKMEFGGNLKEYGRYVILHNTFLYNIGKLAIKLISIM